MSIRDAHGRMHDARGRFAISIGGGDRKTIRIPERQRPSLSEHTAGVFRPKKSGRKKALTRWSEAYDSQNERLVNMRENYDAGRSGPLQPHPSGRGVYRPTLRTAGWKVTGQRAK